MVSEHLKNQLKQPTAYIYCNYKEQTSQTVLSLLGSLLKQIVLQAHETPKNAWTLYSQEQPNSPSLKALIAALEKEIDALGSFFVVVDALDEYSSDEFVSLDLINQIRRLGGRLKLLVTSRSFGSGVQDETTLQLSITAQDDDVRSYIQHQFYANRRLALHVKNAPDLAERILVTLTAEKFQGMFLLASFHVSLLERQLSRRDVRKALDSLPETIEDVYSDALNRIENQQTEMKNLAHSVLSLIIYAYEPLTWQALQHAIAVTRDMTDMDDEAILSVDDILHVCAGLVMIESQSGFVKLVHYTTQEYFDSIRSARFPNAHADIANVCLRYITFDPFQARTIPIDEHTPTRYPLYSYAARNWGNHLRMAQPSLFPAFLELFLRHSPSIYPFKHAWVHTCYMFPPDRRLLSGAYIFPLPFKLSELRQWVETHSDWLDSLSGLHIGCWFGLEELVRYYIDAGIDLNQKDTYVPTPLSVAVSAGHSTIVSMLLQHSDVQLNTKDADGGTVLLHAAMDNSNSILQLLLNREDLDVNVKDESGWTALFYTFMECNTAGLELLLTREDLNVNIQNEDKISALGLASSAEKEPSKELELLLRHKNIDINIPFNEGGRTILWSVVDCRCTTQLEVLLDRKDLNVNVQSKDGDTVLMYAVRDQCTTELEMLLGRKDLDVNLQNKAGQTALWLAVDRRNVPQLQLLLTRKDLDIDSADNIQIFGFWFVLTDRNTSSLKELLKREDLNVEAANDAAWNILEEDDVRKLKTLLPQDFAHVTLANRPRRVVLWRAVRDKELDIVGMELLLKLGDIGVSFQMPNREVLLFAEMRNKCRRHELLVRENIDLYTADEQKRTFLWDSKRGGRVQKSLPLDTRL
ncbi:ankyrin repeat-containing domain protein [Mycena sp. CBHHK59/15]|nr:ankyrin repeat-containing domain protein [Mycena sp. CBHHK59/15]